METSLMSENKGDYNSPWRLDKYKMPKDMYAGCMFKTDRLCLKDAGNSQIQVVGYDDAYPLNRVRGNLTVRVTRNRSGPQFSSPTYTRRIRADFPVGDPVIDLIVSDDDNDELIFENLASDDDKKIFMLNTYDRQINLVGDITGLTTETTYTFQVRVYDDRLINQKEDIATVAITVIPLFGPPQFLETQYSFSIPITTPIGTWVFNQIRANHPDIQGELRYGLEGFPPGINYFDVDSVTANISTKASLNNEYDFYLLYLSAYDTKARNVKGRVAVNIFITRNLKPPVFLPPGQNTFIVNIKDYVEKGTEIINMTAVDSDITSPENLLTYSLIDNGNDRWFRLDASSGIITIKNQVSLDTNKPPSYTLLVVATDRSPNNPLSTTATVTVNVDRNRAPQIQDPNSYVTTISEGVDLEYVIFTIVADDSDPVSDRNGELEYYIADPQAKKYFMINSETGEITPRTLLKDITVTTWAFTVGVRDNGFPQLSDETTVRITITRVGLPFFPQAEYNLLRDENLPVGTELITVQAQDPNSDGALIYVIRGDGLAPTYFRLEDNDIGKLLLNKSFTDDNNKTPRYKVRIHAYRERTPNVYAECIVNVEVTRNPNDPTILHGDLVLNISETIDPREVISKINATDPDRGTNGEITFFIDSSSPPYADNYFHINPKTGELSVIKDLRTDRNVFTYELEVVAQDGGPIPKRDSVRVTINVMRNPGCPRFTQSPYTATINETVAKGTRVVMVSARDEDGDAVEYGLISNEQAILLFTIQPGSGWIVTNSELYIDQAQTYKFQVTAKDTSRDAAACTSTVDIEITVNRNPNYPYFLQDIYRVRISEYTDVNTMVQRVFADDDDPDGSPGSRIYYRFSTDIRTEEIRPYFTLSQTTGEIYVAKPLTTRLNLPDQFNLTIYAYDRSVNPKETPVTVEFTIVRNQFTPKFNHSEYLTVEVNQYEPMGSILYNLNATDGDSGVPESRNTPNAQVGFRILEDQEYSRFFDVDANGLVYSVQQIAVPDSDQGNIVFNLTVEVTDLGWEPRKSEMTIEVTVKQTVGPKGALGFEQPIYYEEIPENHAFESMIDLLNVVNQEGYVDCEILSGNKQGQFGPIFSIRRSRDLFNCELYLINGLDYEIEQEYKLQVKVKHQRVKRQVEGGQTSQQYQAWPVARIIIKILDINDNTPNWVIKKYPRQSDITKDIYFKAIDINTKPGREVLTIKAVDKDAGELGRVTYNRGSSDREFPANPPFQLNETTGVIISTLEFGKEDGDPRTFRFPVQAHDQMTATSRVLNIIDAEVIVHLVEPKHRFVLEVKDRVPDDLIGYIENIRLGIQEASGYITLIEQVVYRRYKKGADTLVDETGTDIIFVFAELEPRDFPLLVRQDSRVEMYLADGTPIIDKVSEKTQIVGFDVHGPYEETDLKITVLTKSYIWWSDDPWAALIALAGISILLCIVGIIVLVFTHSRYLKYISNYRVYQQGYEQQLEFVEPPSFLKEYETQSLAMYVPPDEPALGTGEIQMNLSAEEGISVVETSGGAAINPVYQADDGQQVITYTTREVTSDEGPVIRTYTKETNTML